MGGTKGLLGRRSAGNLIVSLVDAWVGLRGFWADAQPVTIHLHKFFLGQEIDSRR